MPSIAFLGLGHMGAPMARRLVAAGRDVVVWNRTHGRTVPLVAAGARAAPDAASAVSGADLVLTMLSDPDAVESVLFGPSGVVAAIRPGACLVEMSTIGPDAVRAIAARLTSGVGLVDAPVAGGVGQAEAGQLRVLAGGRPTDLDRVEPVLAQLGTVVRCGEVGSGAAAKLMVNTGMIAGMALLGETLALADALNLPRDLATHLLAGGPLAALLHRAQAGGGHFTVELAAKDLTLAMASHARPVAAAALATLRDAAARHGKADLRVIANLTHD